MWLFGNCRTCVPVGLCNKVYKLNHSFPWGYSFYLVVGVVRMVRCVLDTGNAPVVCVSVANW